MNWITVLAALVLLGSGLAAQQSVDYARQPVGWYVTDSGRLQITWCAYGDLHLQRLGGHEHGNISVSLSPGPDSTYTWRTSNGTDRIVTFERNSSGWITAMTWPEADGRTATAPRDWNYPYDQEEVTYRTEDTQLRGLLMLPRARTGMPGIAMIHGSGSSDRHNLWAFEFADHLARHGVAVLLPDKRGSGESGGDWREADFSDLAADALAAVKYLRAREEIQDGAVGVLGLSQGGRVAPLAAAQSSDVAFVIDISGSAVNFVEGIRHEMRNTFIQGGLDGRDLEKAMTLHRLAESYIRTGDWSPYERALQTALESDWAEMARGFPQHRDARRWTFFRGVIDYDPVVHWRQVRQPAFIAYGEADEHDNVPVGSSVARLERVFAETRHDDHVIRVYGGTGHSIRHRHTGRLRADMLDELLRWIAGVVR